MNLLYLLAPFTLELIAFFVALLLKRDDIADVAWGPVVFCAGIALYLTWPQSLGAEEAATLSLFESVQGVALLLTALWAGRLTLHLAIRLSAFPEDRRYKALRSSWGESDAAGMKLYQRRFLSIYLLQGVLSFLAALPLALLLWMEPQPLGTIALVGFLFSLLGLLLESYADFTLLSFKLRRARAICEELMRDLVEDDQARAVLVAGSRRSQESIYKGGVWGYVEAPNYLGELLFWLGLCFVLLQETLLYAFLGLLSPLFLLLSMRFLSGAKRRQELH